VFDDSSCGGFINLGFTACESASLMTTGEDNDIRDSGSSTLLTFP
jgi:hypothetical protein